jgi:hypothetical protein
VPSVHIGKSRVPERRRIRRQEKWCWGGEAPLSYDRSSAIEHGPSARDHREMLSCGKVRIRKRMVGVKSHPGHVRSCHRRVFSASDAPTQNVVFAPGLLFLPPGDDPSRAPILGRRTQVTGSPYSNSENTPAGKIHAVRRIARDLVASRAPRHCTRRETRRGAAELRMVSPDLQVSPNLPLTSAARAPDTPAHWLGTLARGAARRRKRAYGTAGGVIVAPPPKAISDHLRRLSPCELAFLLSWPLRWRWLRH